MTSVQPLEDSHDKHREYANRQPSSLKGLPPRGINNLNVRSSKQLENSVRGGSSAQPSAAPYNSKLTNIIQQKSGVRASQNLPQKSYDQS